MRIINRQEFLKMPSGTVYAKVPKEWIVEGLCVKFDSVGTIDWYYMSFDWVDADDSSEAMDRMDKMKEGESYPVQNSITRDGLFDQEDQFMIYEKEDVETIIKELSRGL